MVGTLSERPARSSAVCCGFVAVVLLLAACGTAGPGDADADPAAYDGDVVAAWNEEVVANIEVHEISPTVAGRLLAHVGLAMHEALATGPTVDSLSGAVADLPAPPDADGDLWWPAVVAGAASTTARALLVSDASAERIDALLASQRAAWAEQADDDVLDRSLALGAAVGDGVVAWSADDGFAESADDVFVPTGDPGTWEPTPPGYAQGLEPGWGTLRTFLVAPDACTVAAPVEFSAEPGSAFYEEALAVHDAVADLDDEDREVARFWNMEPNTGTPAGHWMRIVSTVSEDLDLDLPDAARASATVAIAMHDAFVLGWQAKYDTDVVRPVTYLREVLDPDWLPYLVTPQFPEYPSGHSFVSGAAAASATAVLGERPFEDDSNHDGVTRSFTSFDEAAEEAAASRLVGGVHYPMGVEAGMDLGACIGEAAVAGATS